MAKYETVNEPVFVTSINNRNSKYGNEIYEVTFKGIKTQKDYKSYIDPNNNNFREWAWLVDAADKKGIVISNLKLKDTDKGLINADSKFTVEYVVTREELADCLAEYWSNQSKFNQLFGDKA